MLRTVSIMPGIENLAPERTGHQQRVVRVAELRRVLFLDGCGSRVDLRGHLVELAALLR